MKKMLLSAAALTLLFTACKKDDNKNNNSSSWTLGSTSYTATTVVDSSGTIIVGASNGAVFLSTGASSFVTGSHKIVEWADSALQIDITAMTAAGAAFSSTDNHNVNADVTVNNGKVSVTVPEVWLTNLMGTDSLKFSGTFHTTN